MGHDLKAAELVDDRVPTCVELRIHGVGGSSPESILDEPQVVLVRGDGTSGFYRRSGGSAIEAYSWGGLTSRSRRRVLWVLLAPFAFLNVAGWMLPPGERRWHRLEEAISRWVALYATVMVTLLVGQPAIETIAYKCGGVEACRSRHTWLGWMTAMEGAPGERLIVGAVFPLIFLIVLRRIARRSHHRYEHADDSLLGEELSASMTSRTFWIQGRSFLQLARLHLAAGCTAVGLVVAGTMSDLVPGTESFSILTGISLAWLLILGVWVAAIPPRHQGPRWLQRLESAPPRLSAKVRLPHTSLLITIILLAVIGIFVWSYPGVVSEEGAAAGLDWYGDANVFAAVVGSIVPVVMLLVLLALDPDRRRQTTSPLADHDAVESGNQPKLVNTGFDGFGTVVAGLFGFVLAMIMLGALNGGVANWIGNDSFDRVDDFGVFAIALVALLAAIAPVRWILARRIGPTADDLHEQWPGDESTAPGELDQTRRTWLESIVFRQNLRTLVASVDTTVAVVLLLAMAVLVVEVAGEAAGAVDDASFSLIPSLPFWEWLEPAGWWLLVVGVPGLSFWLVRKVYTDVVSRRAVGIVWDIATFFPRWYHPFAPPSYAGRAVPELQDRLAGLATSGSSVIVSAHSQGSVLALAGLASLADSPLIGRVALLTHGSPIGRLYCRYFPRYFFEPVQVVAKTLGSDRNGRWRNLYRPTDPIGGAIGGEQIDPSWPIPLIDNAIEEFSPLRDPTSIPSPPSGAVRFAGDPLPPPRGHSNYYVEPAYHQARDLLETTLGASPVATPEEP